MRPLLDKRILHQHRICRTTGA